jgi:hypothetical protein
MNGTEWSARLMGRGAILVVSGVLAGSVFVAVPAAYADPSSLLGGPASSSVNYYNVTMDSGSPWMTINELKTIQQDLQGVLDSMNEMSEMTSMRLQMAMDRRSK